MSDDICWVDSMKIVYRVHVDGKKKTVDEILLLHKSPGDTLDTNDLEAIFMAHQMADVDYHMTGYPPESRYADYIVDLDPLAVWLCLTHGWRKII